MRHDQVGHEETKIAVMRADVADNHARAAQRVKCPSNSRLIVTNDVTPNCAGLSEDPFALERPRMNPIRSMPSDAPDVG